ncbi:hypothetical protein Cgig2_025678 [Carnegiea gigantea]|uniref:Uncharacterized protein n=1 Tax=Carnegiea gigantea TaxID=171969 RepID=A0A9Q1Q7E4_9CARY|nr:hypothetical protein Cgig2_025678 [Carnegiea gigantea]
MSELPHNYEAIIQESDTPVVTVDKSFEELSQQLQAGVPQWQKNGAEWMEVGKSGKKYVGVGRNEKKWWPVGEEKVKIVAIGQGRRHFFGTKRYKQCKQLGHNSLTCGRPRDDSGMLVETHKRKNVTSSRPVGRLRKTPRATPGISTSIVAPPTQSSQV